MQISVAGCSWGVCFATIAFSIVSAFCANGIQPLLSATSKVALHWSGMIVEFRIFAPLTNEKVCLLPFCYHLWIGGSETSDPTFVLGIKKFAVEIWVVLQPSGPNTLFKQNLYWRRTIPDIFVMTNCCDSWGCFILWSSTDAHLNFLWYCSLSQIIYVLNLKMHSLFLHLIIQGLDRMFGRFWNNMKLWKRAGRYPCVHMCVLPRENLFTLPS